jgi:hypothetical protein
LGDRLNGDQIAAMDDGMVRAGTHLTQAATLDVTGNSVRITNMTGHKVISGYPEGRRMWLNIVWKDAAGDPIPGTEVGAYGPLGITVTNPVDGSTFDPESILDLENTTVYEVHPSMTQEWANLLHNVVKYPANMPLSFDRLTGDPDFTLGQLAAQAPGTYHETFHFALNNHVAFDNRIPPYQMSYDEAQKRNALPVPDSQYGDPGPGGVYDYWDEFTISPPAGAATADLTLYYQGTSWEYVQFLNNAVSNTATGAGAPNPVTPFLADEGKNFLDAWVNTGMVPPYVMATATWGQQQDCTYNDPAVTISPAAQTITTDGGSVVYNVEVTNNDSGTTCADAIINLAVSDSKQADFETSTVAPSSVTLAPGGVDNVDLTVTAIAGVISATNDTTVTASSANHGDVSDTVTTTLDVQQQCEPTTDRNEGDNDPAECFDGLDNDCVNGIDCADISCDNIKNGWCDTGNFGVCQDGQRSCSNFEYVCIQDVDASQEGPYGDNSCIDGDDNDCDGLTDAADPDCQPAQNCGDYPDRGTCKADPDCVWDKNLGCIDAPPPPTCSDFNYDRGACRDAGCNYDNKTGDCTP